MKHHMFITLLITSLITNLPATDQWTSLFNGSSLDGWIQRGGKANYSVEDGCIVGTTVPKTPNSFLCTEKDYGDFILEYEFKIDPRLNSGVQIRSQLKEYLVIKSRLTLIPTEIGCGRVVYTMRQDEAG